MLSRDKYCTLIVLSPRWSIATYFDSGNKCKPRNYNRIKGLLDEALEGYAQMGGHFHKEKNGERLTKDNKHIFWHGTGFHCIKHAPGSVKDGFYVLHHIKGLVRDVETTRWPSSLQEWSKNAGEITDSELREDFHRIQRQLSLIILEDVMEAWGSLHNARGRMYCKRKALPHSIEVLLYFLYYRLIHLIR